MYFTFLTLIHRQLYDRHFILFFIKSSCLHKKGNERKKIQYEFFLTKKKKKKKEFNEPINKEAKFDAFWSCFFL